MTDAPRAAPHPGEPFALPVRVEESTDVFDNMCWAVIEADGWCFASFAPNHKAKADFIAAAINAYSPHPGERGPLGWVVLCWRGSEGRAAEVVGDERGEDDDRTLDGFHLTHAAAQTVRDEYAARWPALRYTIEPIGAPASRGEREERRCIIPAKFDDRRRFNRGRSARIPHDPKAANEREYRDRRHADATPTPANAPSEPSHADVPREIVADAIVQAAREYLVSLRHPPTAETNDRQRALALADRVIAALRASRPREEEDAPVAFGALVGGHVVETVAIHAPADWDGRSTVEEFQEYWETAPHFARVVPLYLRARPREQQEGER